jgi:hypothetical protein
MCKQMAANVQPPVQGAAQAASQCVQPVVKSALESALDLLRLFPDAKATEEKRKENEKKQKEAEQVRRREVDAGTIRIMYERWPFCIEGHLYDLALAQLVLTELTVKKQHAVVYHCFPNDAGVKYREKQGYLEQYWQDFKPGQTSLV